jgi:Ca2+-binding RTX toxin-like protein
MARVDASFGPATVVGYERSTLPTFSDVKTTYLGRSGFDVEGYVQASPGVSGGSTAPFTEGEWIPVETSYTGSFTLRKVKRGRKRYNQLKGGTVYQTESWYGDEHWTGMSGFAISLKEMQASGSSVSSMNAFERKLLSGADIITGSRYADYLFGLTGNDNIDGGKGNDVIHGGDGDDIIKDGSGVNVIYGGTGRDRFILSTGDGVDGIYDYEPGVDILDTSNLDGGITTRQDGGDLWIYSGSEIIALLKETSTI